MNNKTLKIALDAMGGDFAPKNEIEGAILAYRSKPADLSLEIILVGQEKKIKETLAGMDTKDFNYSIVHAEQVVTMDDDPVAVFKHKKNSSLYMGAELCAKGLADAFVSPGNTGAVLSVSTMLLGRIKGVSRPTIGTLLPSTGSNPTFLLDVGATVDLRSRFLYEYGIMGSVFVNQILGLEKPKVGLLNVGEEETKGTDEIREAYAALKSGPINFIGNVEGRDILQGVADVVVCDGYTGNIVLKFAESFLSVLKHKIKDYADAGIFNKLSVGIMVPTLKNILKEFDYQNYGGVPLLGVNGVVIIGHGKSSPKALMNMINRAIEFKLKDVNTVIEKAINQPQNL